MEFIFVHNAWFCVPATERDLEIGLCLCLCMCQVVLVKSDSHVYVYILRSREQAHTCGPDTWRTGTSSGRVAVTHGDVLNVRTESVSNLRTEFFSVPHQTHRTHQTHTKHTHHDHHYQHHTTHHTTDTTSTHTAQLPPSDREIESDMEKHNRCVVDAGRLHYPVIGIPPDTICPRSDLIFNDTAELQRHLASMEYSLPEGHSLVINAETSVGACGSELWQKIRDRWRARRAERETKTHQTAAWRDDVTMGSMSSGQKGSAKGANKSTDAKLHNAVLETLCVLSQQVREV